MKHLFFVLLLFSLSVSSEEKTVKTIADAVKMAVEQHPAVSAASKGSQAAKAGIGEAESELYPSVDLRAAYGREENENSTVTNDNDRHRTLSRFESSIVVRQNLYTGGRISNNIEKRQHLATEAFYNFLDEKERTAFTAVDAYLEFCRNRALIKLAENNVKIHQEILDIVEERKKRGMSRDADVIQVKGRLALAKAQYQRELANKKSAIEQFSEAVGAVPADDIEEPASLQEKLPEDLKAAKNTALTEHPVITARTHNVEASQAAAREVEGAYYPQVALEFRGQENDNIGGTRGNDDTYSAMVVVNWNVFRGGADKAAKVARLFEAEQASDLLIDQKRKISRNIGVSWFDYQGILVELNYFLQHEKASKETLEAYREQYKLNRRTLFDLLNAQNELFLASSRVIETNYSKFRGVYSIFANMGNITQQFIEVDVKKR